MGVKTRWTGVMSVVAAVVLASVLLPTVVDATHYRFGTIEWFVVGSNPLNVTFVVETAWRAGYFPTAKVGTAISVGTFNYGDGASAALKPIVSTINTNDDWLIAASTLTHVYSAESKSASAPYIAYFSGGDRLSTTNNNANKQWNLQTAVNLTSASASPASKALPIATIAAGGVQTLAVPAVDPFSTLSYRFATSNEICGLSSGCTQPPGMELDAKTGMLTWTTDGLQLGLWSVVVMVDAPGGIFVPVDFLIDLVELPFYCGAGCDNAGTTCSSNSTCQGCDGGCGQALAPVFDAPPTPADSSTVSSTFGEPIALSIQASDALPFASVTIQEASLPSGASLGEPSGTNPVTRKFTWTPTVQQIGSVILCFSATSSLGITSGQYCFTIDVVDGCPDDCHGRGTCEQGVCHCEAGWTGASCDEPDCADPTCSFHGACVGGECVCDSGWGGASCADPTCQDENYCSGHGTCIAYNECRCDPGYEPPNCSTESDHECCQYTGGGVGLSTCQTAPPCVQIPGYNLYNSFPVKDCANCKNP